MWWRDKPLFLPDARYRGQPVMLTEVGASCSAPQTARRPPRAPPWVSTACSRSTRGRRGDELLARYADLLAGLADLGFLAGFCYTQLYDVQHEVNGLLTYDRPKIDPRRVADLHARLLENVNAAGRSAH